MSFGENIVSLVGSSSNPMLGKAQSWERVPLSDIAVIVNGYPWKSENFSKNIGVPLIRIRDVTTGRTETRYDGPIVDGYWINSGDLLVGMDGDFNMRRWKSERGLLNQRVCKIKVIDYLYSSEFLEYLLPAYLRLINESTSSVTVKHLSSQTLSDLPIPLPPLAEQRCIVAKLDVLTAHIARARAELEKMAAFTQKATDTGMLFDRLESAILAKAFRGELVPQDPDDEPASVLLERIRAERAAAPKPKRGRRARAPAA